MEDGGLKNKNFRNPKYVGDPINAVKIFNEKEVDEIVLKDISKKRIKNKSNYKLLEDIASEAFMPFAYGGGISKIEQIKTIIKIGVEKIILNTSIIDNPDLISQAVDLPLQFQYCCFCRLEKKLERKYKSIQDSEI